MQRQRRSTMARTGLSLHSLCILLSVPPVSLRSHLAQHLSRTCAGRFVVANYAGNEHAAADFFERTFIPTKKFDVSDTDATEQAFREIEEEYGPVEILVNNAGITRDGTMHRMDRAQWQAVIDTNLSGCFNCSRSVIMSKTSASDRECALLQIWATAIWVHDSRGPNTDSGCDKRAR